MNKQGDVTGRFSVNLILDKMGIKVCDEDDPINNNDVLKDEIVLHKVKPSENFANDDLETESDESVPVLKVKRGRPPKKQNTLRRRLVKPETKSSALKSFNSSSSQRPLLKREPPDLSDTETMSSSNSPRRVIPTSVPAPIESDSEPRDIIYMPQDWSSFDSHAPIAKKQRLEDIDTSSESWNVLGYSNESSISDSGNEDDIFTLSTSSSTPRSTHFPPSFSEDTNWGPKLQLYSNLEDNVIFSAIGSPLLIESTNTSEALLESIETQHFPFMGLPEKININGIDLPSSSIMSKDISDFPLAQGIYAFPDIVGPEFNTSGIL